MRAHEFIKEQDEKLDEFFPALAAAAAPVAGAVGRGALAGAQMVGRGIKAAAPVVARGVQALGKGAVNLAGQAVQGMAKGLAGGEAEKGKPTQLPKPGGIYNHPTLGPLRVLPPAPGQRGIKLDTTQKLGFPIVVDPNDIQQVS